MRDKAKAKHELKDELTAAFIVKECVTLIVLLLCAVLWILIIKVGLESLSWAIGK